MKYLSLQGSQHNQHVYDYRSEIQNVQLKKYY